jgi:large subunit ribosomal protein L1
MRHAKFDESIDVAVNLGVDAKKSDQTSAARWCCPPARARRCASPCSRRAPRPRQAKAAGADIVGMEDLAEQVKAGFMDFDVVIASPDAMRSSALGQILGPRGLMPNPKVGTVTPTSPGREERQGRPGAVPDRQGGHHPVHDRPRLVPGRGSSSPTWSR